MALPKSKLKSTFSATLLAAISVRYLFDFLTLQATEPFDPLPTSSQKAIQTPCQASAVMSLSNNQTALLYKDEAVSQPAPSLPNSHKDRGEDPAQPRCTNEETLSEHLRRRLATLPPEQQEKFRRNWQRWKQLPQEERERIRRKHRERIESLRKEAHLLIEESGISLDETQRQRFERYYLNQLRALELELIREMEARRQQLLPVLRQKLLDVLKSGNIPDADWPPWTQSSDNMPPSPSPNESKPQGERRSGSL